MTKTYWYCNHCGSYDVMTMNEAWFDPNNDYVFIESVESTNTMDWCNACNDETVFDEATEEEYLKQINDIKRTERMNLFMKEPNND